MSTSSIATAPELSSTSSSRQSVGQPCVDNTAPDLSLAAAEAGRTTLADLMRATRAYDVMPESSKVIFFDLSIPIRLAFYALVEHGELRKGLPTPPQPHPGTLLALFSYP